MQNTEKIWAIVPAAGIGKRMMSAQPKQYLPLAGRRVIDHALEGLCRSDSVDGVVVGIRAGDSHWQAQPFAHAKLTAISPGGAQRAHTVLNALGCLLAETGPGADGDDWVMVHDAVRPCLSQLDIERLITAARNHGGGAVLALRVADTLKRADSDGRIESTADATSPSGGYWRALTPQMFRCAPLQDALRRALEEGGLQTSAATPTDESAAMEMTGMHPALVEGNPANIKITVPADLELAARYLSGATQ